MWESQKRGEIKERISYDPLGCGRAQALQVLVEMTATRLGMDIVSRSSESREVVTPLSPLGLSGGGPVPIDRKGSP